MTRIEGAVIVALSIVTYVVLSSTREEQKKKAEEEASRHLRIQVVEPISLHSREDRVVK